MRWERRGDVNGAVTRMRNGDAPGQEVQPILNPARQLPILLGEIFWIPDDRMIHIGTMRTQLMCASGHRLEREPGERLPSGVDYRIIGDRVARSFLAMRGDAHA